MELLSIITFAILGALAVLPVQAIKTDRDFLRHKFWAHDYGLHLVAAAGLQIALFFIFWFKHDAPHALLLATFFNGGFWAFKEIMSPKQHVWTFKLLPKTTADWRDWRMSMYGITIVTAVILIIIYFSR